MNQTTNQKILVVEDSLDSQLIIRSALGADYHLRMVGSSTDARNVLAEEMYDLLILDIRLPDGSGQEICRELQSDPKYKHMPIIFLTSKTATEDKVQGFEVGADDYITKPFEPDELRARVQARLRKLKQIRDASDSMVVQNFHIDLTGNQVSFKLTDGSEQKLDLTPNEFKISGAVIVKFQFVQ